MEKGRQREGKEKNPSALVGRSPLLLGTISGGIPCIFIKIMSESREKKKKKKKKGF